MHDVSNDDFFRVIDPANSRQLIPRSPYRKTPDAEPKTKQKPEAKIQAKIVKWLESQGLIVHRINSGVFFGASGHRVRGAKKGSSDLVVCYKGRYVAIEVKAEDGEPTEEQQDHINRVNATGGLAFVARSVEDVKRKLLEVSE